MADKAAADTTETQASLPLRSGPALSATSDAPDIQLGPRPPVSEARVPKNTNTTEATSEDKTAGDADTETKEATGAETGLKPTADDAGKTELPPWAKREITKSRNKERAAEARAQTLEANLKKALETLESLGKASAEQALNKTETADPKPQGPQREKFDDPRSYDAAVDAYHTNLVEWSARTATRVAEAKLQAKQTEADEVKRRESEAEVMKTTVRAFEKRKVAFLKDHPDYEDVAEANPEDGGPSITLPMRDMIIADDDGPAIAYFLGQNPDESERIAALTPIQQVAALGRIAARLNAKPSTPTKPSPINPLKTGSGNATRKSPDEESMDEYGARRTPEILAKRKPFIGGAAPH